MAQFPESLLKNVKSLGSILPQDHLTFLLSIFLIISFGQILNKIKMPFLRYSFGLIIGFAVQTLVCGWEVFHLVAQSLIVYWTLRIFQRKAAVIVFIQSFLYISYFHLQQSGRQIVSFDALFMASILRWISFAFDYADGNEFKQITNKSPLIRSPNAIRHLPNILEYLSYMHFFGSCLIGPFYEFNHYKRFIEQKSEFQIIPSTIFQTLKWTAKGALFALSPLFLSKHFPIDYVLSQEFKNISYGYQWYYMFMTFTAVKFVYYTGWCFSQAGFVSTGASYSGSDNEGNQQWDKIVTIDPFILEKSTDVKHISQQWNKSVQYWLYHYVYRRIANQGNVDSYKEVNQREVKVIGQEKEEYSQDNQIQTQMDIQKYLNSNKSYQIPRQAAAGITFLISAIWHGFHISYYIGFFIWFIASICGNQAHQMKIQEKLKVDISIEENTNNRQTLIGVLRSAGRYLFLQSIAAYIAVIVGLKSLDRIHKFLSIHNYGFFVILFATLGYLLLTKRRQHLSQRIKQNKLDEQLKIY